MSERRPGPGMLVVLALDNNALLRRGDPFDPSRRRRKHHGRCQAVAAVARDHRVVINHGNGPQVGLLGGASTQLTSYALDVLDAESEGMVGYLFEQEPLRTIELEAIRILVGHDIVVTCTGGGGIPVVDEPEGLTGVEAVIDKDLAAGLRAV